GAGLEGTPYTDYGYMGLAKIMIARAAVSYVTGSHAFKTGFTYSWGNQPVGENGSFGQYDGPPVKYTFRNRIPVSLTEVAWPTSYDNRITGDVGIFAQDQWAIRRLTLNLGLRFDGLNAYNPPTVRPAGFFLPALSFPAVEDVPNWKDINPRVGVAYDLFGNGKT